MVRINVRERGERDHNVRRGRVIHIRNIVIRLTVVRQYNTKDNGDNQTLQAGEDPQ